LISAVLAGAIVIRRCSRGIRKEQDWGYHPEQERVSANDSYNNDKNEPVAAQPMASWAANARPAMFRLFAPQGCR
jgi:hypothetical protein